MPEAERKTCPRCGKSWLPWAKSKLDCHAKCYFTEAAQDDIYQLKLRFPRVSVFRLARDFKVPLQVIQASLAEAAKRATRPAGSRR